MADFRAARVALSTNVATVLLLMLSDVALGNYLALVGLLVVLLLDVWLWLLIRRAGQAERARRWEEMERSVRAAWRDKG